MTNEQIRIEYAPDQEAQEAIWCHACRTPIFASQIMDLIDMADEDPLYQPEICVSKDTEIGKAEGCKCGLLLKGKVVLMAVQDLQSGNTDSHSNIDPQTGQRLAKEGDIPYLVKKYKDLEAKDCLYTESWLRPTQILAFWMKQDAKIDPFWIKRNIGDVPIIIV